jgi:hypothetical protein
MILGRYRWFKRIGGIAVLSVFAIATQAAYAGTLTNMTATMSRQKVSTNSTHRVMFRIATDAVTKAYRVDFPDGFTMTSGAGGTVFTGGTGTPGTGTNQTANGAWTFSNTNGSKNAKFTYTATYDPGSATEWVELNFSGITNPSSNGSYTLTPRVRNSADSGDNDSGQLAVPIQTEDQVTVTATVDPSITFTVSPTSVALGTLSSGSVTTSTQTDQLTVNTNAAGGYIVTGQGSTLSAGTPTIPFTTDGTVTAGVSEYGIDVDASGTPCTGNTYPTDNGGEDFDLSSTKTVVSNTTGPVSTCRSSVLYRASVTGSQAAGSYQSVITWLATGTF